MPRSTSCFTCRYASSVPKLQRVLPLYVLEKLFILGISKVPDHESARCIFSPCFLIISWLKIQTSKAIIAAAYMWKRHISCRELSVGDKLALATIEPR